MNQSKHQVSSNSNGIGLATLLGITFIVLKLCKVIEWSWLWVLSPFWIPITIIIAIVLIILIAEGIVLMYEGFTRRNR